MAKLFIAVYPKTKCDKMAKDLADMGKEVFDYEYKCEIEPNGRDANYYEICFGEDKDRAKIALDFIKNNLDGVPNLFSNDLLMQSVYGLYKAEILPDDITMEQFINGEAP